MREIKFRAWFIDEQKLYDWETIVSSKGNNTLLWIENQKIVSDEKDKNGYKVHNYLMQYTGLKDKNGVEIYEGDVIKYDFNNEFYRIEYVNAEFIGRRFYEDIENLYPTEFNYGSECKVIGNIFENPELLEPK